MPVNHYFNNFSAVKINEQRMYEDLIVESVRMHGHDVYYMPREQWSDTDRIYGENIHSVFQRAYMMEMYIANVQGWDGDSDFFGKFGLEIRDTANFIVCRKTFDRYTPSSVLSRPREGDLMFVPVMNRVFEIKFVEEELLFFSKGLRTPFLYELRVEMFRWNREKLDTGIERIDELDDALAYTIKLPMSGSGAYNIGEVVYQGANLTNSTASAKVSNWDPTNKELYVVEIKGTFANNSNVVGVQSSTNMRVINIDSMSDNVYYDMFDNKEFEDEANTFVDMSETNPFGSP